MGLFSWLTSDTHKSISADIDKREYTVDKVFLLNPFGPNLFESDYEGYGVFGGQDVYELVAIWNVPDLCKDKNGHWLPSDEIRNIGIDIACSDYDHVQLKYPIKLVEHNVAYEQAEISPSCPFQGYFYSDIDDVAADINEIEDSFYKLNQVKACYKELLKCHGNVDSIIQLLKDKNNDSNDQMWHMAISMKEIPKEILFYVAKNGNQYHQQSLLGRKDLSLDILNELIKSNNEYIQDRTLKYYVNVFESSGNGIDEFLSFSCNDIYSVNLQKHEGSSQLVAHIVDDNQNVQETFFMQDTSIDYLKDKIDSLINLKRKESLDNIIKKNRVDSGQNKENEIINKDIER